MYNMNDLFNSRDVVGCKLNQIIGSRKYTKSNVCTSAGISRPTLDSIVTIEAYDEVEVLINFKNISMIQLPLAKIECDIKRSLSETDNA